MSHSRPLPALPSSTGAVYNRLIAAMGRPDMGIENPRFATDALRCQNEREILDVSAHQGGMARAV